MIFKYLMTEPGGNESWEYYDNVKIARTYYDEELHRPCVKLYFDRTGLDNGELFPVNEVAYLMNDNGKTIESFHGPVLIDRDRKQLKDMGVECVEEIGIKYDND